ncbi:MAG: S8 family serine peptidase [Candidatus Aminicenantes bacterium]|nr:S8 family serine peptidase [Candidatus Aminicenantes bacterium]
MKQKHKILKKILLGLAAGTLFCLIFSLPAQSQPRPLVVLQESELNNQDFYEAWVEFKDKGIRTKKQQQKILRDLEENFNLRALVRRKAKRTLPGLFDESDFPLSKIYLNGVAKTGVVVKIQSRWLNGISILATKKQIGMIKKLPYVTKITDFHKPKPRRQLEAQEQEEPPIQRLEEKNNYYGRSMVASSQLGLDKLHKEGFTGRGIRIAVIDAGFDLSHTAFRNSHKSIHVVAQWDFVENDENIIPRPGTHPTYFSHGTSVLGTIAAYAPNELLGTAYDAEFILCNAEDGEEEYYLEERLFVAALEFAEAQGADVLTTSLVLYDGYTVDQADGKTSIMTLGMSLASGNGIICLTGSGNYGHDSDPSLSHLMTPGDTQDIITVGAITPDGSIARFSSDGPTADGRLKPEVLALGSDAATISIENKNGYAYSGGTSIATPIMAGAVACLLQTHPEWTGEELRQALFRSGDYYLQHGSPDPLFIHGYGIPDVFLAAGLKESAADTTVESQEKITPTHRSFMEKVIRTLEDWLETESQSSKTSLYVSWETQKSNTQSSIRGISAVDDRTCWISGSQGTFARTTDGGQTWIASRISGNEELDFRDIEAFDENTALVLSAGRPAKIFKTTDGGTTWEEKYSNQTEGIFFDAMAFWNKNRGIAVSDPINGRFFLIQTFDAGESWEEIPSANCPQAVANEAGFAASGTCLTVQEEGHVWFGSGGAAARIHHSIDWGSSWTVHETPLLSGLPSQGIFSVAFKNKDHGIIVGGDYRNPDNRNQCMAVTEDGGSSWTISPKQDTRGYRSCVLFIPGTLSSYIAVGGGGSDITHDDGKSWNPLSNDGYFCLSIEKAGRVGWSAGADGQIAKLILLKQ